MLQRVPRDHAAETTADDAALMVRLAAGDASALGPLHQRYRRRLASFLLRSQPGLAADEVDDLVQDVFLTLWETAGRYQEQGRLLAWLFGIAVHRARSVRRRAWFRRTLLRERGARYPGLAAPRGTLEEQVEAASGVTRALSSLAEPFRDVLLLHSVEGLSSTEIALALGIAEKTVWTRLHRARKHMLAALEEER